ncbi:MAG: HpcH/HpaI aldolase/citrate lyase family protein [Solirubrobacteraceae bacterium]
MNYRVLRSMLYVPADNERRVGKAFQAGADAVIVDLEDSVAVSRKVEARAGLSDLLADRDRPCAAYVRVNAMGTPNCLEDIEAAVAAGADGISLPMVEQSAELHAVSWLLGQLERKHGRDIGATDLLAVLETGVGLQHATQVLSGHPRVRHAGLGVGDLQLSLGLEVGPDEAEIWPYRRMLVLACNAAGLEAPLDTVYLDLKNLDGLRAASLASKRAGFQGRRVIHPSQVEIVNEAYSPTSEELERAERIVQEFDEAEASGLASMRVGEDFVDYPIAQRARRVLAVRDALQHREPVLAAAPTLAPPALARRPVIRDDPA